MEDVLAVRDEYRLQGWAEIIRERQASGLTNKEFCAQRGITEKTYYYWLRKEREAAAETVAPQLVRLEERGEGERAHRIEIRYGEAELKLPEDVDLRAVSGCVGQGTVPCPIGPLSHCRRVRQKGRPFVIPLSSHSDFVCISRFYYIEC